ncbi:hypothetical protein [Nocardia sp. NBC_01009]|uniref:hypothetical protein n=1 Tax=Nocardia sp. NBC_01009 TaxID=2975996 RepID=UPI00387056C0|nr:hypothetical protein OHA42_27865 [Nocardia sp. NBC_01009]
MQLTWDQVFAWRLGQQFVAPPTEAPVPEIVDRLCGVQAQVTSSAELAVALQRRAAEADAVVRELNSGTLAAALGRALASVRVE